MYVCTYGFRLFNYHIDNNALLKLFDLFNYHLHKFKKVSLPFTKSVYGVESKIATYKDEHLSNHERTNAISLCLPNQLI